MTTPRTLKSRLPHTWTAFFARHGSFTPVQEAAIPPILDGYNSLVIAATAGGKTEAAIVPLLERYCFRSSTFVKSRTSISILYLAPTRALVRDLYERLRLPLEQLEIPFAMKSGDTGPVSISSPPTVLITTPESTDSLLTRAPRLLAELDAIVLDEIHLLDGGPRGDQLRCLLRRIEHIRSYHQQQNDLPATPLQRIALSATVPDPEGIAARYLIGDGGSAQIIAVPGRRELDAEIWPMRGLDDLTTALAIHATGESAARKFLLFCNSRSEVEQTAAFLRGNLPFEAALFTHYSNLDPALRQQVEDSFAEAAVAICVSTSTLELGIDIGSIDEVVLIGPPPSLSSFQQRIGRGGRRTGITRVLCLPRSALEEVRFQALIAETVGRTGSSTGRTVSSTGRTASPTYRFLSSVLVQQSFSILAQSPTGGIRLADLRRVAPEEVEDASLHAILAHLTRQGYLRNGRLGEWRAAEKLDELVDKFEIYANIGGDPLPLLLVDAFSGRTLATVARSKVEGETLRLGGHMLEVVWRDRYRVGVRRKDGRPVDDQLRFATTPFAVPLESGQAVAGLLGLAEGLILAVPLAEGTWLFHFWGDVYGSLLAEMLDAHFGEGGGVMAVNEFCLYLPGPLPALPGWDAGLAQRALYRLLPRVEPLLELGRFHTLLPEPIARQAVLDRLDLPQFQRLYQAARVAIPPSGLRARLEELL